MRLHVRPPGHAFVPGRRPVLTAFAAVGVAVALAAPTLPTGPEAQAAPATAATESRVAPPSTPADLDVMFIGAHPDDEAGRLAAYGQWAEDYGVKTGVITVTRGEGGGNAVGNEEGPALGLIREDEERRAVGKAGITDIYNLDDVDFYYTVSEPLTKDVWSSETLEKVVRVIRQTTPEILFTMDPAPSPGNHGNHQEAALLALMAYEVAGDPSVFPEQITKEGLKAWSPSKIFGGARGSSSVTGETCATNYNPTRATQNIYGVWPGKTSTVQNKTWAQIERNAQREYASQGWSVWPDANLDVTKLSCKYFTQFDARVPYVRGDFSSAAADPRAALWGAVLPNAGGLPLGTQLDLQASRFQVTAGGSTEISVSLSAPAGTTLKDAKATLSVPSGWTVSSPTVSFGNVGSATVTKKVTVTAAANAATNARQLVSATATAQGTGSGYTDYEVEVVPNVRGTQQLLPQVSAFQKWAAEFNHPEMEGFVTPVLSMAQGGSREVAIEVTNFSAQAQSGTVDLSWTIPGFSATPVSGNSYSLAPGATTQVKFTVTNTDPNAVKTSNEGGDYPYTITTAINGGSSSTTKGNLEIVPTTTIPQAAAAPALDGVINPGEYTTEIDVSRLWEGDACTDANDCSAKGYLTRYGDDLYVAVDVTDDVLGTKLDVEDCKRHWRTDSVEIAIDPAGRSENTSTTFKALVLPTTAQGVACFGRDADNNQGGPETAPGMEIGAKVKDSPSYTGYVVETKIPASVLPSTIDPNHMGLNVFVYDSDTQDKTGQTRIGWSTWGGVQGDPYRWGLVTLPGWNAPAVATKEPVVPRIALSSFDSPQSIDQSARNGVALAGKKAAAKTSTGTLAKAWLAGSGTTVAVKATGNGTAHLYALNAQDKVVGSKTVQLTAGRQIVGIDGAGAVRVLLAYESAAGGSTSTAMKVSGAPAATISAKAQPASPVVGGPASLVVTVDGGGVEATGTVKAMLGGKEIASGTLAGGTVTLDLAGKLAAGKNAITLVYSGDSVIPTASTTVNLNVRAKGSTGPVDPATLTDTNKGGVSVPDTAHRGETITVTMPKAWAGDQVAVWMYSTPVELVKGKVSAQGTVQVTVPSDAELGDHKIVVTTASGDLRGWDGLAVIADSTGGGSGSDDSDSEGLLAWTGGNIVPIALIALALIAAGGVVIAMRRRRLA